MEEQFSREDLEKNRTAAALGYIMFFFPLVQCKDSKLGRYCANQGLILLILIVLVRVFFAIFAVVPFIGWLFQLIGGIAAFGLFVVGAFCMARLMTNGQATELPFVGMLRILPQKDEDEE